MQANAFYDPRQKPPLPRKSILKEIDHSPGILLWKNITRHFTFGLLLLTIGLLNSACTPQVVNNIVVVKSSDCNKFSLASPAFHEEINTYFEEPAQFSWSSFSHPDFDHFQFELYQAVSTPEDTSQITYELAHSTSVKTNTLSWPANVPWNLDLKAPPRLFSWTVSIIGTNGQKICPNSPVSYFSLIANELDVENVSGTSKCKDPAYVNGKVCYTITESWTVKNTFNDPANIIGQIIINDDVFSPPYNPIINPAGQPLAVIPANSGTVTLNFSYDICVPIGATQITSQLAYVLSTDPLESSTDKNIIALEPCICEECDRWRISLNNLWTFPFINTSTPQDYVYLIDQLQVTPNTGNIVEIAAEIVHFEEIPDTIGQCKTCNNQNNQHAVFVPYIYLGNQITQEISGNNWVSNFATSTYNREAVWTQNNPAGINISSGIGVRMTIGLPKFSDLRDCCSDCFIISIRYTFTAFDEKTEQCIKCAQLVHYDFCRNSGTPVFDHPQLTRIAPARIKQSKAGTNEKFLEELKNQSGLKTIPNSKKLK